MLSPTVSNSNIVLWDMKHIKQISCWLCKERHKFAGQFWSLIFSQGNLPEKHEKMKLEQTTFWFSFPVVSSPMARAFGSLCSELYLSKDSIFWNELQPQPPGLLSARCAFYTFCQKKEKCIAFCCQICKIRNQISRRQIAIAYEVSAC